MSGTGGCRAPNIDALASTTDLGRVSGAGEGAVRLGSTVLRCGVATPAFPAILDTKVGEGRAVGGAQFSRHVVRAEQVGREDSLSAIDEATKVGDIECSGGSGEVEAVLIEIHAVTGAAGQGAGGVTGAGEGTLRGIHGRTGGERVAAVAFASVLDAEIPEVLFSAEGSTSCHSHAIVGVAGGREDPLAVLIAHEAA